MPIPGQGTADNGSIRQALTRAYASFLESPLP